MRLTDMLNSVRMQSAEHTTLFQPSNIPAVFQKRGDATLVQMTEGELVIYVFREPPLTLP